MSNWRPDCPKCGSPLSFLIEQDRSTKEMLISIECEWCEEFYGFTIRTGIKPKDIKDLAQSEKPVKMQVEIVPNPDFQFFTTEFL
jgi:transcription elongation factor Elf1